MAVIGEMRKLTIGDKTYTISSGSIVEVSRNLTSGTKSATITVDGTAYDIYSTNNSGGTVTSVRVQATSPVQSSTSTAQSSSLNTTISLANAYGDTKNPYGTKTANYVLAGPSSGSAAAPSFRALVAADIPDLSETYLTSYTETDPVFAASAASGITSSNISTWNNKSDLTLGTTATTAAKGNHTHTTTLAADSGTSTITLASATTYKLTAGGTNVIFKMPTIPTVNYPVTSVNSKTGAVTLSASDVGALASDTTYVSTITTTAGAHTAITSKSGTVSFNIPTTAAHVGAAASSHAHGNITSGGDITATAPTIANGDQIIINDSSASKITNGPTFDGSTTTTALTPKGTWESFSKFSGSYNDLTNKPTIPTVPTDVSAFTNDAGYITSADVPEGASAYTGTISAVGTSASAGTNNGFARGDHVHNITSNTITSALGYTPYNSTNPNGYISSYTDEKLKWTASTTSNTYYPLQSTSTATTSTANTLNSISFYQYYNTAGGYRRLTLGNDTAYTSTGGAYGTIRLYGTGATYYGDLNPGTLGANRTWTLPNATGTIALTSDIPSIPTTTGSKTTGITATTTATKTTLGTAFTIPNVTSVGSASSWAFEDIACDDITSWSAGSASSWAFTGVTVANSISGAVDSNDSTQLNITLGTTTVQSKSSGSNGSAPSLSYTARTVSSKKSGSNGSAPSLGTAFTVPNVTGNSTGSVSITDNGHTHSI